MTANDFLISGGGRLDPDWFKPYVLTDLLTTWLASASGTDQVIEATVYTRAFETLVSFVMSSPASQRDRDKSDSFSDTQLRYWQDQAAYWRSKAEGLTGRVGPALVQWEGEPLWHN